MRRCPVLFLWAVGFGTFPAFAQSEASYTVEINPAVCSRLLTHVPAPDVAYQPGVDVHGNPVAPADLPSTAALALPDRYDVEITVDTARRFGFPIRSDRFDGEVDVGVVTIDGDRVLFNGRPVTGETEKALVALCRSSRR